MSSSALDAYLREPHVAILSVSRAERGPVAVPVWYDYDGTAFRLSTSPASLHSQLMVHRGRATLTMHSERYEGLGGEESYAIAEGPIAFTDEALEPLLRRLLLRYRGADVLDEALAAMLPQLEEEGQRVALLMPEAMSGYTFP